MYKKGVSCVGKGGILCTFPVKCFTRKVHKAQGPEVPGKSGRVAEIQDSVFYFTNACILYIIRRKRKCCFDSRHLFRTQKEKGFTGKVHIKTKQPAESEPCTITAGVKGNQETEVPISSRPCTVFGGLPQKVHEKEYQAPERYLSGTRNKRE